MNETDHAAFGDIVEVLSRHTGVDVRRYRQPTVYRRLRTRMLQTGATRLDDYLARLRESPVEAQRLLEQVTIKVSAFFRNEQAFEVVGRALCERARASSAGLSIWSAGCAHGQEPYSFAMWLEEHALHAATILATDIDATAIEVARDGWYSGKEFAALTEARLSRFFEDDPRDTQSGHRLAAELRQRVRFAVHDLTTARPPAPQRFDLICCRNTLIYFQPALRARVLTLLRSCLAPEGLLWLGESEWLPPELAQGLVAVDRAARLFRACSTKERV